MFVQDIDGKTIVVSTYDMLNQDFIKSKLAKVVNPEAKTKKYIKPKPDQLTDANPNLVGLFGRQFARVAYDEVHRCRNPSTMTTVAAMSTRTKFRLGCSGTPFQNKARDLGTLSALIGYEVKPGWWTKAMDQKSGEMLQEWRDKCYLARTKVVIVCCVI